ncbi:DUF5050 domain-containing protein [Butyricicoccus pullicaecorum]|nr:DUF5050 domain-containing protein [Butyricicoccus pullicaecorum]
MMKKIFFILLLALLCCTFGCSSQPETNVQVETSESSNAPEETQDSSESENMDIRAPLTPPEDANKSSYINLNEQNKKQNGAGAYIQGDWLYCKSYNSDGKPYFVKMRKDLSEFTVLDYGYARYITISDGILYYSIGSDKGNIGIYKMNMSGDNKEKVSSSYGPFQIVNDKIYYVNIYYDGVVSPDVTSEDMYNLYRCDLDGSNIEKIISKPVFFFFVFGDEILYQDDRDGSALHIFNMETNDDLRINDMTSFCPIYDGEYIYYAGLKEPDTTSKIWRIKPDGSENTLVSDTPVMDRIVVTDNHIYFANLDDSARLYRINKDGTGKQLISQEKNTAEIQVFDSTEQYPVLRYITYTDDWKHTIDAYYAELDGANKITELAPIEDYT